jgi:hypothetical protein
MKQNKPKAMTAFQYWKGKAKLAGYRSAEELFFNYWLNELEQEMLVSDIRYEPCSIVLCEKAKYTILKTMKNGKEKTVTVSIPYSGHTYTPDFLFNSDNEQVRSLFHIPDNGKTIYVDVKGGFSLRADKEAFPIKQAWIFDKYGIWINRVIPDKLFKATFVSEKVRCSPLTNKPLPKYRGVKTLKEWM